MNRGLNNLVRKLSLGESASRLALASILLAGGTVGALAEAEHARGTMANTSQNVDRFDVALGVRQTTHNVRGLQQPATMIVDLWGIPHLYAASHRDAFFMQGYNAARDRLWQIDLWRKRGLGLLAKDFGPSYVDQDRAARLFLYRGDMAAEWQSYGPHAKDYADAFVAGVNAYVQETRDGAQPLPDEFKIAGTRPDFWNADDIVRIRSHGLTRNVESEVQRAQIACAAGLGATRLEAKFQPAWTTKIPDGLDPCSVPRDVLKDYFLATAPVKFSAGMKATQAYDPDAFLAEAETNVETIGSNNWVVSGSRTATGRPILANDPHRDHSVPSLRYIVHLVAPGMNVIGAGEPALPGISIGHNDHIAFGLTIFGIDQEDLYVEELNPANPDQVKFNNAWEPVRVVQEQVEVKGEAPRDIEMRFTRHGPILATDASGNRAFAIRSVWFEPGTSAYFGSSDYMTAQNWPQFLAAMKRWGAPSENQVYADTKGNIGWQPGGLAPRRLSFDGLLPVPGDGRYEWQGFLRLDELPSVYNPAQGYFATANQMNLPPDYPIAERRIGFDSWADPARWDRIVEALGAKKSFSLADAMDLQNDDTSIVGRRLVALVKPLHADDPKTEKGLQLLQNWNASDDRGSAAAALFEVWVSKHIGPALVNATVPEAARKLLPNPSVTAIFDLLENPDASLGADPAAARDKLLLQSVGEAVGEVSTLLGDDPNQWRWGKLHHAQFDHALEPLADPSTQAEMRVGPLEISGASNVPHATSYRTSDFRLTSGASFRMVLDVGNWDASRAINTPGESGNPFSPHYRDLAPLWANGQYVPLLYSKPAIENAASEVVRYTPAE
jgi:penicillin G amidase